MPDIVSGDYCTPRYYWSGYNRIYYNPAIRYTPPLKSDGSPFPDATFSAAWRDGYEGQPTTTVAGAGGTSDGEPGDALLPDPHLQCARRHRHRHRGRLRHDLHRRALDPAVRERHRHRHGRDPLLERLLLTISPAPTPTTTRRSPMRRISSRSTWARSPRPSSRTSPTGTRTTAPASCSPAARPRVPSRAWTTTCAWPGRTSTASQFVGRDRDPQVRDHLAPGLLQLVVPHADLGQHADAREHDPGRQPVHAHRRQLQPTPTTTSPWRAS